MRHWIGGVVVIAFGLTTACQGGDALVRTVAELQAVRQAVVRATGHSDVQVRLAGAGGLSVSLVNSPLMALPGEKRHAKALDIARVVFDSYPRRASLQSVKVTFLVRKWFQFIAAEVSSTHTFQAADLAPPPGT
jgi:hypothetical protein